MTLMLLGPSKCLKQIIQSELSRDEVVRYRVSESIPSKFEHKLCRHKQRFGRIVTTLLLDKDENLL